MNILISAKNASTLQKCILTYQEMLKAENSVYEKHFRSVEQIYNDFVENIIKYLCQIRIRIEDIFLKRREHAFEDIEKLIIEMEGFRQKIPILELRMSGIFYRVVDEIRGYIRQLKKDTDQWLVRIDKNSDIVTYRQFANFLLPFKRAEWIYRICPDTYDSFMCPIVECLTEHAEQLEKELRLLNFHVQYSANVSIAYQIVKKMELMSILESSVPQLEQYRNRITEIFREKINAVLNYIRHAFNLQNISVSQLKQQLIRLENETGEFKIALQYPTSKYLQANIDSDITSTEDINTDSTGSLVTSCEEQQEAMDLLKQRISDKRKIISECEKNDQAYYFSQTFDAATVNDALQYISECEKLGHSGIKESVCKTSEVLQNYVSEYGHFLNKEIASLYRTLTNTNIERDPLQYAHALEMRVEELFSLRKFSKIFRCIDGNERLTYWQQEFFSYYSSLYATLEEYKIIGDIKAMKMQLTVIQALTCVDRFDSGCRFHELYKGYQLDLYTDLQESYKNVLSFISNSDYVNASLALSDIDEALMKSKFIKQIKHELHRSLANLMKNTTNLVNSMHRTMQGEERIRSQIKDIRENVDKLRVVVMQNNIMNLVDYELRRKLELFDDEISESLSDMLLRHFHTIEMLIDNYQFYEVEKAFDCMTRVQYELVGYCELCETNKKLRELKEKLVQLLDRISTEDFTEVHQYLTNPPKYLLDKLKVVATEDPKYKYIYTILFRRLTVNFRRFIDEIPSSPRNERIEKLKSLNYAIAFLPDELHGIFQEHMNEVTDNLP